MPQLISIGSVGVDVVPNAQGVYARLAAQILPDAERIGDQAGRQFGQRMQAGISSGIRDGIRNGGRTASAQAARQGSDAGGAFGRAMRTRLEAALRALPNITIGANTSEADADIQALRVRLESLRNQRVGIDIDAAQARAEAEDIEEQLRRLGAAHPNVQVRVDTAAARAALAEFRAELDRLSRTSASPRIEVDGGFSQRLRAAVEAAQAQLPVINVDASTSQAAAEIQSLRAQLDSLRTARVGIDVDAATALARITQVQARLEALAASHATVDVRVDAAAAAAQLAAVQAQVNALDGDTARIDVDVSGAIAGLTRLSTLAASIGPALVPLGAGAAFGLGAFTSMLATATVGVGAFAAAAVPSLKGVGAALQATTQANEAMAAAQDETARSGASQAIAAQQQALTMAGAQQSLAAAQRNAAQQVADAQQRVRDAVQGVADAQEEAARRNDQALDKILSAQRQRTAALADEKRAQDALTQARADAAQQLEDLAAREAGAALDERAAVLAVEKAELALQKVKRSGASADSLTAREAQLTYDEAVQRLEDQRRENARLATEVDAANKAGVDGAKGVLDAQSQLADAQQKSADAAKGVADAQKDAARTQVEGAKSVAKAQAQVADAQRAVVRAQQQGAEAVASAQRQVTSAQLAAAAAAASTTEALSAANVAADKQKRALEALTPAQRGVYDAVQRLKTGFKAWGDSLSPAVLPIFTRAIDSLTNMLPKMTPFVLAAADGIRQLQDRASKAFQDPFWERFRANLAENIPRAIVGMGVTFGNVFTGFAGIINAFVTDTDRISSSMENATGKFRDWGQNLDRDGKFREFSNYVHETWPGVKDTLVDVGEAMWQLVRALSAVSPSAVLILQGLSEVISHTPVWVLQALIDAFFAYRVAVAAVAVAQVIYVAAMGAYSVVTAIATGATISFSAAVRAIPLVGLILTILTLIGTFVLLMIQSESFRAKVVGVFKEIGRWGVWLWQNALKPAFDGIAAGAVWLYQNALKPAFDGISLAARILAAVILTVLIAPVVIAFNLWSAVALWLWNNALSPVFSSIASTALWLWSNVLSPTIGFIMDAIRGWGLIGTWLWENAISPAFSGIAGAASWLWDKGLRPPLSSAKDAFLSLGQMAQTIYQDWIKPWFDKIAEIVSGTTGGFSTAFSTAKEAIGRVWSDLKGVVAEPINWVITQVYSNGVKAVWDKVAKVVGLPELPVVNGIEVPKYATGGIYPGYTPGRDIGLIGVSGGEAIIRPEGTRALGADFVHGLNAASRSGGVAGAQAYLGQAPMLGGFAFGGIVGDIIDTIGDATGVGQVIDWTKDLVRGTAAKAAEIGLAPVRALVNQLPDQPDWLNLTKRIPLTMMDKIVDKIRGEDEKNTGFTLGGIANALAFAKSQAGKPYQWGGGGNPSYDCSGFMAAIEKVLLGQSPIGRLFTTFDFQGSSAPPGWKLNADSAFKIGVTNVGSGHTAGTLSGLNVESRGGDGIVVGPRARGWNDPLFTQHYGFVGKYDSGGPLRPGFTLAYNGTGKTEQVYTNEVNKALLSLAARGAQTVAGGGNGAGLADGTPLRLVLDDGSSFMAHIEREIAGAGVS